MSTEEYLRGQIQTQLLIEAFDTELTTDSKIEKTSDYILTNNDLQVVIVIKGYH